ncbi:MAG: hypothetical protein ACPL4H_04105, partial [Anaerolineales bacterium]
MLGRILRICLTITFLLVACKTSQPINGSKQTPSVITSSTAYLPTNPIPLLSTPTKTISSTYATESVKTALPSP